MMVERHVRQGKHEHIPFPVRFSLPFPKGRINAPYGCAHRPVTTVPSNEVHCHFFCSFP